MSWIWLTQAHYIFKTLEIPQDEWENYGFSVQITLTLEILQQSEHCSQWPFSSYYLFVNPFLQFSNSILSVLDWTSGTNIYYWSTDPSGHSVMTERECFLHGLPCYHTKFQTDMKTWSLHHDYDYMQSFQEAEGFDPSTTDYARSLGQPLLKIVFPEKDRFEAFSDDIGISYLNAKIHLADWFFAPRNQFFCICC
ncbi:hypothetical protein L218DRAFT_876238 [Marasmius fiardii PR-910]|nr:hypothetical protein L218DRAFT_876238 [Marasmius fiardii PR-910]